MKVLYLSRKMDILLVSIVSVENGSNVESFDFIYSEHMANI